MIDFKFFGNWKLASRALNKLPSTVTSAGVYGQRRAAELLVKIAKGHINNQDLGWAPRSIKTKSGDSRILVDTEAYFNSIKAWKRGNDYFAGVPKDSYNARGISIIEYALAHEYGFGDIPERPLWRPTYEEIGGRKGVESIVKEAIRNKITKLKSLGFEI